MLDQSILDEFSRALGSDFRSDPHARGLYSTDASIYQVEPMGVVEARTVTQALTTLGLCARHRVPVLPRGGGTSLAGQCVNDAVVLDMSGGFDSVISVDPESRTCRVEPGVTIEDLNDSLAATGLFFTPDPSTARQATVAGCIGNNAAGAHSVLYGRTSENVLTVDVWVSSGERLTLSQGAAAKSPAARTLTRGVIDIVRRNAQHIRSRYPKTLRRSTGYQLDVILDQLERSGWDENEVNLAPLVCGSEGTLAVTLGAELKLHPRPKHRGLALLSFTGVLEAINAVEPLLELEPASIELLDELIMELAQGNRACREQMRLLPRTRSGDIPGAVLYVEFFAQERHELNEKLKLISSRWGSEPLRVLTDPAEMDEAWKLRKAGEPLLHAVEGSRKPLGFIEDNAIPVPRLGEFVERLREIIKCEGTRASYYAHASVGVLHIRPLLDLRDPSDEDAMIRIADQTADLARELGGVASGEHGDGRARGPFLERFFGPELLEAHREIKALFDPIGILNPGNIVEPGPIESIAATTRIRPQRVPLTIGRVDTGYRYDDEGGFAHAIEMCNGAGVCRKKSVGTMCPSYQGTLEERHSTRGRGNALRRAMTGQSKFGSEGGDPDFNDPETLETLRLCLSCKACKTECPSSVDIAKLKSEYLYQHQKRHGFSLKSRAFARVHTLNRLASLAPWVSNSVAGLRPVRSFLNHALGLAPDRSLPRFHPSVRQQGFQDSDAPKVVVLSDTMTTHTEPWIAHAAREVLASLGYDTSVVPVSDMARASLSQGDLDAAKQCAIKELGRLVSIIDERPKVRFVMVEPSMLSSVIDDWGDIVPERLEGALERARSKISLAEHFVHEHWDKHPSRPDPIDPERAPPMRVHTHCHQKSLMGSDTSLGILERLAPGRATLIDAGCCGMSGAFGYSADTAPLANTIGEMRLAPDVRAHSDTSYILASGTSCRHMILDLTGVHAWHPIEAVAMLMGLKPERSAPVRQAP